MKIDYSSTATERDRTLNENDFILQKWKNHVYHNNLRTSIIPIPPGHNAQQTTLTYNRWHWFAKLTQHKFTNRKRNSITKAIFTTVSKTGLLKRKKPSSGSTIVTNLIQSCQASPNQRISCSSLVELNS